MQAGKCCRKAVCSPYHFVVRSLGPGLYREDLKRKRNFITCYGKLFYQLNVVKLLFNKDCQSWTCQRGAPGTEQTEDRVIPGKAFSTSQDFCCHPICQTFDGTDTWWLPKSWKQTKKDVLPFSLRIFVSCDLPRTVTCFTHRGCWNHL